jgi:hypothetical protein
VRVNNPPRVTSNDSRKVGETMKKTIIEQGPRFNLQEATHRTWISVKGVPPAKRDAYAKKEARSIAKLYGASRFYASFYNVKDVYEDDTFEVFFC